MTKWLKPELLYNGRDGEVIGGGWFVFRRGKKTGRISGSSTLPFEHPTFADAAKEAGRLSRQHPGESFVVLHQVSQVDVVAKQEEESL